jgi:tetrahydromethanopterin S-methyltransferase subunit G
MDLRGLLSERDQCHEKIATEREKFEEATKVFKQELSAIEDQIENIIAEPVKAVRQSTGKDTGTVDVLVDGVMVKHNLPKKVKWDQEKLAKVWSKIIDAKDNPNSYMKSKTTYTVAEKAYKNFIPAIKKVFEPARTVVPGAVKVSFDTDWR